MKEVSQRTSRSKRLGREFFARYTPDVAKNLLGCLVLRKVRNRTLSGKIVEVEAYRGRDDPASHSYRGLTKRTALMFGEAGHVYMFFSMGAHWCMNFTTEIEGEPGAVLIRALEPVDGIEQMRKNRGLKETHQLMSGPGKLTKALSIDSSFNGEDLVESRRLYVLNRESHVNFGTSVRIGITKAKEIPWRFYLRDSPFVSKRSV